MSDGGIDESYRLSQILKKIGSSDDSRKLLNQLLTCKIETLYANARAVELLKDWVTPDEWEQLKREGCVTCKSRIFSNVKYEIGNVVYAIENENRTYGCIHVKNFGVPVGDSVLARIIGFKKSESEFVKITNWHFDIKEGQLYRYVVGANIPATHANPNQYPDALTRLHARKETIDIRRAGLISCVPTPSSFPSALVDACIKYGLAQALIDNLHFSEQSLCVRGILPEFDLIDGDGYKAHRWSQGPYQVGRNEVYQTSRSVENDRKVYIIFGARNLKPFYMSAACGMEVKGGAILQGVQEMYIQKAHVKIIDVIDISGLQTGEAIWFRTPIFFKRSEDMVIEFNVPPENVGMTDNIQLLGLVVEPLGSHMAG